MSAIDKTSPVLRDFGPSDYTDIWRRMRRFVREADSGTREEIWLLSHHPVFTLGQTGKREHLLNTGEIPVLASDRGGQVTYHGPGQLVAYPLLNLRRRAMGIRGLVQLIEQALIDSLAGVGIRAKTRQGAPGVYVGPAKIAALGLRIRRGWSYHGLSLNVDMDLDPFALINPCGYPGLKTTQVADFVPRRPELLRDMGDLLVTSLLRRLEAFPPRASDVPRQARELPPPEAAHA